MSNIKATIVSVELNVTRQKKNGDNYSAFKVQYVTESKENKTYFGLMTGLKFNKKLAEQLNKVKEGTECTLIFAKNKFDYDELQSVDFISNETTGGVVASGGTATQRSTSNYETKEERAQKQLMIVRQSCLGYATTLLKTEKKQPSVEEVIELAERYADFVYNGNKTDTKNSVAAKQPDEQSAFDVMDDDIPF